MQQFIIHDVRATPHKLCSIRINTKSTYRCPPKTYICLKKINYGTYFSIKFKRKKICRHILPSCLQYITNTLIESKVLVAILRCRIHYHYWEIADCFKLPYINSSRMAAFRLRFTIKPAVYSFLNCLLSQTYEIQMLCFLSFFFFGKSHLVLYLVLI